MDDGDSSLCCVVNFVWGEIFDLDEPLKIRYSDKKGLVILRL